MEKGNPGPAVVLVGIIVVAVGVFVGLPLWKQVAKDKADNEKALAQVTNMATKLDGQTTDTGVYIRVTEGPQEECDPWGTPLEVRYSQGGLAEAVSVRSAGKDKRLFSSDDLVRTCMSGNAKGIGTGVLKNVEEFTHNGSKGIITGVVDGGKEAVKSLLPGRKKEEEKKTGD